MELFRSFVRSYAEELRQLERIRTLLLENGSQADIRSTIRTELQNSIDEPSIRIGQLKEFLLTNGSFHTDGQLRLLVERRFISNTTAIELESFVSFVMAGRSGCAGCSDEKLRSMYRRLYLYQLLNQSVGCESRLDDLRQKLRHQINPKECFRRLKSKYENQCDGKSIMEACQADAEDIKAVLNDIGMDRLSLEDFYRFLGYDESVSSTETARSTIKSPFFSRVPRKFDILVQVAHLNEYLRRVSAGMDSIEKEKEDIINEFGCVSYQAMFLLFSNSLNRPVDFKHFKERLSWFGLKAEEQFVELFYRRFCSKDGFGLESAKRFITPIDDSFSKILNRREMRKPNQDSLRVMLRLIQNGIELERSLYNKKFRQCGFGELFMHVDQNKDTFLCSSDVHCCIIQLTVLFSETGKTLSGREIAHILHRFTRGRSHHRMTFSDFAGELQQ